jgi:hypothetical protein
VLGHLSVANHAILTGRSFFPRLISGPFRTGVHEAFAFAIGACVLAAVVSWSRGRRFVEGEAPVAELRAQREGRPAPLRGGGS